jgi:quercetin dioxygenase-like cupin family protein
MAEKQHGKYMITQPKPNFVPNFFGPPAQFVEANRMAFLDDEVIKGGFYVETVWFTKGAEEIAVHPHTHDYDEVLAFYGSNTDNPDELGGEIEEWIDDEKYIITKSCLLFVPRGIKHGPLIIRRVDRPIFHFATGNTRFYHGKKI